MYICTLCKAQFKKPEKEMQGSFFIELILWIAFIVPGLIYTTWRYISKLKKCPKCGSQSFIPLDTPEGARLASSYK